MSKFNTIHLIYISIFKYRNELIGHEIQWRKHAMDLFIIRNIESMRMQAVIYVYNENFTID